MFRKHQILAGLLILALSLLTACSSTATKPAAAEIEAAKTVAESSQSSSASETAEPTPEQEPTPAPYVAENPDIRNINWGATMEQVIAAEGREPDEVEGKLFVFSDETAAGKPATLFYQFNDEGKCCSVSYILAATHSNDNDYISDYKSLKEKLTDKYGEPAEDREIWNQSLFKDDPERYGLAVACGHLRYLTMYNTDKATISLFMNGDNYQITTLLKYDSTEIEPESETDDNSI